MTFDDKNAVSSTTTENKSVSPVVLFLKNGQEPTLQDMADYTFQSVVLADGRTLENLTFADLSNVVWQLENKNV